jgi:hypothetical protein
MEVFGDLYIDLAGRPIEALVQALEGVPSVRWRRNEEMESAIRSAGDSQFCFTYEGGQDVDQSVPPSDVWLTTLHERGQAYVPNILPNQKSELTRAEYNAVLGAFIEDLVVPACEHLGLRFHATKTEVTLEDLMPAATAEALRRFSGAANKSTGASHPLDRGRWNEFLIQYATHGGTLSEDLLGRWLVDNGWDEEHAHRLVIEYDYAVGLLRQAGIG